VIRTVKVMLSYVFMCVCVCVKNDCNLLYVL